MNSLATNLNQVMAESGFVVPSAYIGNTQQDVAQLVALSQAAAMEIVEGGWQQLRKIFSLTLTSATAYPLPTDFLGFISGTMYQNGRWDPVDMPTTPATWALLKSISGQSSLPIRTRIIDGQFQIQSPVANAVIQAEYNSNAPITDSTGVTPKSIFTADSDLWILDDRLFQLELKWGFKREKGLEWQTDLQDSASRRATVRARDEGNSTIIPNLVTISGQPYTNTWIST